MRRVRLLLLLLLALVPRAAQAQRTFVAEYTAEVVPGATVSLRLDGDVELRVGTGADVRVVTRTTYRGRVYGYSNRAPGGGYALRMRREGTGVVIEPEPRPPLLVAGISTVREETSTLILVPPAVQVRVRVGRGDVSVLAPRSRMEVESGRGEIRLVYDERHLASLSARAERGRVHVGGEDAGPEFFRTGRGTAVVALRAGRGDIHLAASVPP